MQIGLIGAGNMARAMARGWGSEVLVSDNGSGRAQALVDELGGRRGSNREVAEAADLIVLAHKPYQLDVVAEEIAGLARIVVSVLGGTPTATVQAAYPDAQVFAIMPNTPVEVRAGALVHAINPHADPVTQAEVLRVFAELGTVIPVPERLFDAATSLSGVGPAYLALVAEAQIDAGIRLGLGAADATALVTATMAGTAQLLGACGGDTLALRRAVTSPGGSTARGLAALEAAGLREAFSRAADAVTNPPRSR